MSAVFVAGEEPDLMPDERMLESYEEEPPSRSDTVPARAAFALGVIYLLLLLLASRHPLLGGPWGTALQVALFVYLPVAIVYQGVRVPTSAGGEAVAGLIGLGVWLALVGIEAKGDAALIVPARSVALLGACLFFGMLLSRILRERNILLPALIVAAAVDIISAGWGFTGQAVQHAPDLVAKLSVAVPKVAPSVAPGQVPHFALLATMGVGDFFFLAFFFAAAARFGLPLRRTFWFVYPLMLLAMLLTVSGVLPWGGVPGLPFIAIGFLAANFRAFSLSQREKRDLALVGVVLTLFVAAMFVLKAYVSH